MLSKSELDQQLYRSLDNRLKSMMSILPTETEMAARYTFSREFETRMERLLQKARKNGKDRLFFPTDPRRAFSRKRLIMVAIIRSKVDLPAPSEPTRPAIIPRPTVKLTCCTAGREAKSSDTFSTRIKASS